MHQRLRADGHNIRCSKLNKHMFRNIKRSHADIMTVTQVLWLLSEFVWLLELLEYLEEKKKKKKNKLRREKHKLLLNSCVAYCH